VRITGLPPIRPKDLRPTRASGTRFTVPTDEGSRTTGGLQPLTSVDMLLAIAAVDEEAERRRQMAAPAAAGLDALEALDQASESEERVEKARAVAEWAGSVAPPADPDLARLQTQIELRALIEIAKLERGD
jgi:hypothetical protein